MTASTLPRSTPKMNINMNPIINLILPTVIIFQDPFMSIFNDLKNSPTWLQFLVVIWIGLTGVIVIAWFVMKPQREQAQPSTQPTIQQSPAQKEELARSVGPIAYPSTPSASDIIAEIDSQSPFMKQKFSENYHGIRVTWHGQFQLVFGTEDDEINIGIRVDENNWVSCKVSLAEYPLLRTLKTNTPVSVTGTIIGISSHIFELSNAKLEFSQSDMTRKK
jgi:hypothetical protein